MPFMQNIYEKEYIHKVYRNITCLGILLHVVYSAMFVIIQNPIPLIYNLFDILFYFLMLIIVTKFGRYALVVALIHFETIIFCVVHTVLFGWEPSFFIHMFAMASLVYFCPYRSIYTPYLFSFLHMIMFFGLYFYSMSNGSLITVNNFLTQAFFVCNNLGAFIIILYVAYVSKASALAGRKELLEENKGLQQMTDYDQMTGLYSRICLRNQYEKFKGKDSILAIGDIDDFKKINDTYGHICGDKILKDLAELMRAKLDPNIFLCRWGGEEFVFLFPKQSLAYSQRQLEEFCHSVEKYEFIYENYSIHFTMTFGICSGSDTITLDQWIEKADQLLYKGKHSGKNIVMTK